MTWQEREEEGDSLPLGYSLPPSLEDCPSLSQRVGTATAGHRTVMHWPERCKEGLGEREGRPLWRDWGKGGTEWGKEPQMVYRLERDTVLLWFWMHKEADGGTVLWSVERGDDWRFERRRGRKGMVDHYGVGQGWNIVGVQTRSEMGKWERFTRMFKGEAERLRGKQCLISLRVPRQSICILHPNYGIRYDLSIDDHWMSYCKIFEWILMRPASFHCLFFFSHWIILDTWPPSSFI